jgi:hypothetical protein
MKTVLSPLLLAVGLLPGAAVAQSAHYTAPAEVATPPNVAHGSTMSAAIYPIPNSLRLKLSMKNHQRVPAFIRLLNDRNEEVYAERLSRGWGSYIRCFDLREMPDGTYTFQISDGTASLPLEFRVESPAPPISVPPRVIALNAPTLP